MSSEKEILARVKIIVADQLGLEEYAVPDNANFTTELGADSLDVVELVMALEEEFEIEIPDESAANISTLQQAVDYIVSNLK